MKPWLQALPLALVVAVFLVVPIVTLGVVSFWDYTEYDLVPDFVLTNYADVFGAWVTYGLGSESQDLPGFVVFSTGKKGPSAGNACWGSGFLPTLYQGVQFRTGGDPVFFHGGTRILFTEPAAIRLVEIASGEVRTLLTPPPHSSYVKASVGPGDRTLCTVRTTDEGDIWMLTLKPAPGSSGR